MTRIVKESGFRGDIGSGHEGAQLSEGAGIRASSALLERVFTGL